MKINSGNKNNKYRKVKLIIQRTKQLQNGARPRLLLPGLRSTRLAQAEFEHELLAFNDVPLPQDK
jgi:DNA-directed RNA polymerase subunit K/omega